MSGTVLPVDRRVSRFRMNQRQRASCLSMFGLHVLALPMLQPTFRYRLSLTRVHNRSQALRVTNAS